MTNPTPAAGTPAVDPYLRSETLGGWSAQTDQRTLGRERLESRAKGTDATLQLLRCFSSWTRALEQCSLRTLERLAANEPVDPTTRTGGATATPTPKRSFTATARGSSAPRA
jgi:hypothetical protein